MCKQETHIDCNINVNNILATGAELKGGFCLGKGEKAILSESFGDLKDLRVFSRYEASIKSYCAKLQIKPDLIVHDMHPDYLSTKWAKDQSISTLALQHHHAHIASCMAEYALDEPVIGFSFDGTGYGDDGAIWGGEVLLCDYLGYQRAAHFDYIPLPGGDISVKEPWRMAVTYLYLIFGKSFLDFDLPFLKKLEKIKVTLLLEMIDKKINTLPTSSAGRLFDAVAAMLNLCQVADFDAQAPIELESRIDKQIKDYYAYSLISGKINFTQTIKGIVADLINKLDNSIISTKFHNTIIKLIVDVSLKLGKDKDLHKVVLSGGVFMNKYIVSCLEEKFQELKIELFVHKKVSTSDAGIALGQLLIAAKKRMYLC